MLATPTQESSYRALGPVAFTPEAVAALNSWTVVVNLADPHADPATSNDDVGLQNLAAPGVHLSKAEGVDVHHVNGPRDCVVARVIWIVVHGPVGVSWKDALDTVRVPNELEGSIPTFDAGLESWPPSLWHRGVYVEADDAVRGFLQVEALDDGDVPVYGLVWRLVNELCMRAKVHVPRSEEAQSVVATARGHRHIGQLEEREADKHGHHATWGGDLAGDGEEHVPLIGAHLVHTV
mmetsp:Transcript_64617/g.140670  ORF Transcript_64617/g.140670 Transcript_64617/m.140670 type:complete len:236 (-) Transcript_64617:747-1454(-)